VYCTKCGKKVEDQADYCQSCGASLGSRSGTKPATKNEAKTTSLASRMLRAAKLEANLYYEVKSDTSLNRQALLAVAISGLAAGIGESLGVGLGTGTEVFHTDIVWLKLAVPFLIPLVGGIASWLLLSLLAYWLGARVFWPGETSATYGGVLRAMGFARSPGMLYIFSFIPYVEWATTLAVTVWGSIAIIIALRQSLSIETGRAVGLFVAVVAPLGLIVLLLAVLLIRFYG
jgi:hypothetical protein